ncbi:hypothetical protein [Geosporobacter ferrireducens]|uniref:Uncharacterized protein n=1 Tax=Geosporobacter ferrireducens TaxID=1424294 RepID=A0A1D8GFU3_9FIRM|nr:hypothetical protein [Geosporobacter ferrireducens]AOT69783.1 hypothetical protein Gferi_09410 [Geosporobacter ferrireducens]MTI54504.1 hypothetical protein [Geosporobacter ferrireducens]
MTLNTLTKFLERYDLPWLLLAVISWIILYFSSRHRPFLKLLPAGIWSAVVGYILERFFIVHKFWEDKYIMIHVDGVDLFIVIGPFFAIGMLLLQYLPKSTFGQLAAVLLWSFFATAIEILAVKLGFLHFTPSKWTYLHSTLAYCLGLMSTLGFYYTLKQPVHFRR